MNPGNLGNCYIVEFFNAKYWINPYSTNVPLLYLLKTLENLRFSDVFRGYRSETLVENRLNWYISLLFLTKKPLATCFWQV